MRQLVVTYFRRNENTLTKEPMNYSTTGFTKFTDSQKAIGDEFETIVDEMNLVVLSTILIDGIGHRFYQSSFNYGENNFQTFFSLRDTPAIDLKSLREHLEKRNFESKHHLEIVLDLFRLLPKSPPEDRFQFRKIRLALFDMDSTLINEEVIDELARSIGVYDEVSAITSRAMNDPTFDFAASLKARVALLKGVPADIWITLQKQVTIATGAKELIAGLKSRGVITGVISGGFTPMAEWLKGELGLDLAFANHLSASAPTAEYGYPHLTGELDFFDGKVIVTPEYKRDTLIEEANKRGIPRQQTLAVGDGSNDLKMLDAAGLGIAWNAKTKTQEMAPMRLNGTSLAELLFLLGPTVPIEKGEVRGEMHPLW